MCQYKEAYSYFFIQDFEAFLEIKKTHGNRNFALMLMLVLYGTENNSIISMLWGIKVLVHQIQ